MRRSILAGIAATLTALLPATPVAADPTPEELRQYSRAFLGAYRLTLEIDDEIVGHCRKYGVDPHWARAICMYESGGNPDLNSHVGAQGYFQVMPRTFRGLGVRTNIEAGIKYLSQMHARYKREDYATAAYNGGPLFVDRNRAFKLETLQYVIGVGHFRTVLQKHEPGIRQAAEGLKVRRVGRGEDWWSVSQATGIPILELRMYNPFHAHRGTLKEGNLLVHPSQPGPLDFSYTDGILTYRSRIGDNPFSVAFVFDAELDEFRSDNAIWRLQSLPENTPLKIDLSRGGKHEELSVPTGASILDLADGNPAATWPLIRDTGLFTQRLVAGQSVKRWIGERAKPDPPKSRPTTTTYKVRKGDTLSAIARRFGTSVTHLKRLNNTRSSRIYIGQTLRVPSR